MNNKLVDRLQVWGFEDHFFIFKDASLGVCLKLNPIDISCKDDESINDLHQSVTDLLNGLGSDLSLQFMQEIVKADSEKILAHQKLQQNTAPDLVKEMVSQRVSAFTEKAEKGEISEQNNYLFIRKLISTQKQKKSVFNFFKNKKEESISPETIQKEKIKFSQVVENLRRSMDNVGLKTEPLEPQKSYELLFDQWNPDYPVDPPSLTAVEDIRDQTILTDVVIEKVGFVLGDYHHRVISLKLMPDQTFASMSEKLCELPFNSRLFLTIKTLDQNKEVKTLQVQRKISHSLVHGQKAGVADLEAQAKLRDLEGIINSTISGSEKIFDVGLNIILRGNDENKLETQVADVLAKIRELSGAEAMQETMAAFEIFSEVAMPNCSAKERTRRVNTSNLVNLLPIYGLWRGHDDPRVLVRNRGGGIMSFDPFAAQNGNFNQIISGSSGSGKSFLVNLLINQFLKEKPRVFILDIGGSYKKSCDNLNGQYVELGTGSHVSINPFDMAGLSSELKDQKIKFLVALVEMMTKEDTVKSLGRLERSELETAIQKTYECHEQPTLSNLREILLRHDDPAMVRLGKILTSWCGDSPYGKFVDHKTTLSLDRDVVCFDLKGLEQFPDLQSICLFLITDLVWREVQKDRITFKFCVMDECWKLLENEQGSQFIAEIFRTFRKYRASAVAISQTMDDFAKSKIASAIIPNSSIKWILKQNGASVKNLTETLQLNPREIDLIRGLKSVRGEYSESFLMSENDRQVVVIESTPFEYWLGTTDPQDLMQIEEIKKTQPNLHGMEVLKALAKKYPKGFAASKGGTR
ncbi:MAG: ATP-binding protein [Bdellovibrionaceae bacterium]|nr:ATP-binding protein [Pseudobdellovibrionaceae bacterium]